MDEELVEDPRDLIGKRLDFVMKIEYGDIPVEICNDVFCKYTLMEGEDSLEFTTEKIIGRNKKPEFSYRKLHTYNNVTEKILNYLLNCNLCIEVFGYPDKKPPQQLARDNDDKPVKSPKLNQTNKPRVGVGIILISAFWSFFLVFKKKAKKKTKI